MKKTVYIYDNNWQATGAYVSENFIKSYNGGDCEEIIIEIPDSFEPYSAVCGDTMVKLGEFHYPLNECLCLDKNFRPFLKQMEPDTHAVKLKIVSRNGRKNLAFTI